MTEPKTLTLPALNLEPIAAVVNANGNTSRQMIDAMLSLKRAYDAVQMACREVQCDVTHGRNYQTHPELLEHSLGARDRKNIADLQKQAQEISRWLESNAIAYVGC